MRASSGDVMGLCVKVILVENALMFRIGIKILLEKGRNLEYIGDVQDGEELLKAIEKKRPTWSSSMEFSPRKSRSRH